jgi:hypothetical protein
VIALLDRWLGDADLLLARPPSPGTILRLEDFRRLAEELRRVLRGDEDGEGPAAERAFRLAVQGGRVQAVASLFACPRATFVEYLLAAPWNLLRREDPPDLRAIRGAGNALLDEASRWSFARGAHGRVALQAENPRCLGYYERLGFRRMAAGDEPFALVPRGPDGWSPGVRRVAAGCPSAEDARSPWLVLEPCAAPAVAAS